MCGSDSAFSRPPSLQSVAAADCSGHPRSGYRATTGTKGRSQPRLKGIVYVVNGTVARIRAVNPGGTWERDDRGYADIPLTPPLTEVQAAEQFPTLGLRLRGSRPYVKGKIREYLPL